MAVNVDTKKLNWHISHITSRHLSISILVLSYNSLLVSRQNVPITSILANCTLFSWNDFDVDLFLIGSKEIIWKTCFEFTGKLMPFLFLKSFELYFNDGNKSVILQVYQAWEMVVITIQQWMTSVNLTTNKDLQRNYNMWDMRATFRSSQELITTFCHLQVPFKDYLWKSMSVSQCSFVCTRCLRSTSGIVKPGEIVILK